MDLIYTSSLIPPLLERKGSFVVDDNIGPGLLFASIFKNKPDNYAIVSSNQYSAQAIYEFLLNFLPEDKVVFFPSDELLRAETLSSSRELLSQRLYAMWQLLEGGEKILVTHPSALLRYLPDPKRFREETSTIKVGQRIDPRELRQKLLSSGYEGSNKVEHSLQFASRGDILDVYSVSYLNPIRIEFFDDEIESIRIFDVATQESLETLREATILPASDIFLSEDELADFSIRLRKRVEEEKGVISGLAFSNLTGNSENDLESFASHEYKSNIYKYYSFALNKNYSILSYFKPRIVFFSNKEQIISSVDLLQKEAGDYLNDLHVNGSVIGGLSEYMSLQDAVHNPSSVVASHLYASRAEEKQFVSRDIVVAGTNLAAAIITIQSYLANCDKVVLALSDEHQRQVIKGILEDQKVDYEEVDGWEFPSGKLGISRKALSKGFEIPEARLAYITSTELFGHRSSSSRFTSRFKNATVLRSYEDLKPGDYVVHEYYGIGQYVSVKTIEVEGVHRDFLHISYAGDEKLYVPLEQFRLVRKYSGREGAVPKLSRLSTGEWEKRKGKIKERVNELADRLTALYGTRAKIEGFAFPPDDEIQKQFENDFPHQLTHDQARSVEEIKADMEKPEAMDRLLCGDVGFGKTEIAFRAAFKAINAGKQVAILCPTTILCRQHTENAISRFGPYGVHIAQLSRLIPDSVIKSKCEEIKEGKIDLIIGTHKLLSKNIVFKNLGLLIVDEEQRFGVEQKERIKELKHNIDVLTLSATPIPRTLQMSLVGVRPLSQINTAPPTRMPIQTYVAPFKEEVVYELIQRELGRHGQVFYIHNRIDSIYAIASRISAKVSGASVGVVHGQMEKAETEDIMAKFYDGEINCLVATSIVENGIDVPNANMIIVEDANRFGLSQLYQIKGRVGRGDRIAYAYLMYKPHKNMNEDAQKRLKAIQEFTELGSGYKIAQRDLMIRGAGDMLGPEQAGFIDTIGLDLYLKLLNEAIEAKTKGFVVEPPKAKSLFEIDAYIPKEYAEDSDKIQLYQQLDSVSNEKELSAFSKRIRDVYGRIPQETKLLIQKKRIDLIASNPEFVSINETKVGTDILLADSFSRINGVGQELFDELIPFLKVIKVSYLERKLRMIVTKSKTWMDDLEKIVTTIHKVYMLHQDKSL